MKRIALLAAGSALVAIPAIIGLSAAGAAASPPANTLPYVEVHRVGHGADDGASPSPSATRHAELGDDKGGITRHVEPGDDRGGEVRHAEPGDDRGGSSNSGHGGGDDSSGHH